MRAIDVGIYGESAVLYKTYPHFTVIPRECTTTDSYVSAPRLIDPIVIPDVAGNRGRINRGGALV